MYKYIYKEGTQIPWNVIWVNLTWYWYESILVIFKLKSCKASEIRIVLVEINSTLLTYTYMLSKPLPTINFEELGIVIKGHGKPSSKK